MDSELPACSVLANPLLQRPDGELDASVPVADPPDLLPFGLLQLADGIDPIVE